MSQRKRRRLPGPLLAVLAVLLAPAACRSSERPAAQPAPPAGACPKCERARPVARLSVPDLEEASGIAASAVHRGVFYVHNDSGAGPRLFAVDARGTWRGSWKLKGAEAEDWEDIARGPCPAGERGSCLYVGDIGNNLGLPRDGVVYVVPEPADLERGGRLEARALRFRYPDGFHDAETLLVHPQTGAVYVLTKVRRGAAGLYQVPMPLRFDARAELTKLGSVAPADGKGHFTAGDIRPDGRALLLRTYDDVHWWPLPEGRIEAALGVAPCELPAPKEPQGEALAFLADGSGYVTVSEGVGAPLRLARCGPRADEARPARARKAR